MHTATAETQRAGAGAAGARRSRQRLAVVGHSGPTIAIGAGGTGGHIYPGLALAAALRQRRPDARILFFGTPRGMESELIPAAGYPLFHTSMVPFARSAGWRRYVVTAITARAAWQSRRLLLREGVDAVVGMGGYPSLPVIAGARLAGIPALIHEANAVPGRANWLSARLTPNVALALGTEGAWRPGPGSRVVGMPISAALDQLDRPALRPGARARLEVPADAVLVVVSGGSQGSERLDGAALELALAWRGREDVRLVIKPSRRGGDKLRAQLYAAGLSDNARVVDYIERMDDVYAAADLMICRAGAATVAELAAVGLASVLVPYPHAPADHQTHNARALVDAGGAVMVADAAATGIGWCTLVDGLVGDRTRLQSMARAAGTIAQRDGASRLADWTLELSGAKA
jgi:UDP-N-acetylglucosamine--N-acetylmuramyl-(pentapeptide) pyrophosphoryl-undecaprenol N-acetylglucosamine transferase